MIKMTLNKSEIDAVVDAMLYLDAVTADVGQLTNQPVLERDNIMALCDYCANLSTSTQVCTECGEPLVDNPEMDWREEQDGQPSELTEWMDFDPDC
jgi:hypothetical protein